jgi:hypothetical protein
MCVCVFMLSKTTSIEFHILTLASYSMSETAPHAPAPLLIEQRLECNNLLP